MTLWFKYSAITFLKFFFWSLLFTTMTVTLLDLGNHWSLFNNSFSLIFEYYALQCIPFILLSIPFCLFLSLALCINKFSTNKEISLVHSYAKNSWEMMKSILLMIFIIVSLWIYIHEVIWSDLRWKYLSLNGSLNKKSAHPFRINHDKGFLFIEKCDIYRRHCEGVVLYLYESTEKNMLFPPCKLRWENNLWHADKEFIEKLSYYYKKFFKDKINEVMVSPEEILYLNGMQQYLSTSELLGLYDKYNDVIDIVILRVLIILFFLITISFCLRHLFLKINVSVGKVTFSYFFVFLILGFVVLVTLQH